MKKLLLFLSLAILFSCKNKNNIEIINRESIPTKNLKGEVLLNYADSTEEVTLKHIIVYNDSIWIKTHADSPYSKNLIVFYNINHPEKSKNYFQYGNGHMEMQSYSLSVSGNKVLCYGSYSFYILDMDSVFYPDYKPKLHKTSVPLDYTYVLENEDIMILNSNYFSYKSVKENFNPEAESIIRLSKENNYEYKHVDYPYFTENIGQGSLAVHEKKNRIIRFPFRVPEILITNMSLKEIKTILEPKQENIEIAFLSGTNQVGFKNHKSFYGISCQTDNYVYNTYMGIDEKFNYQTSPCELVKMDWDGNIKEIYRYDKTLWFPTVIDDKTLYASVYIDGNLSLCKFEL